MTHTFSPPDDATRQESALLATEGIEPTPRPPAFSPAPFWEGLRATGSELWLDTGDMSAAQELWNPSFSAFTVNNTLLNAEVQKGTYDELMCTAHRRLSGLERRARITEIAFILNARHGLRLVERFGARVSVELHTSVAHDIAGTLHYAQRLHALRPDRFYIKVPLTPAGLIATRRLEEQGIPVNLTLGFSARQNYIATVFAKPTFVNVFLGRLNAFIAAAKLGSGDLVGERTTVASWKAVARARTDSGASTRQIAASLRNPAQVAALAGIEVQTMPVKVARAAAQELDGRWESCLDTDYTVELAVDTRPATVRIEKLWDLSRQTREFARSIAGDAPSSPRRLMERAHEAGVPDLFPSFSSGERQTIRNEGKIPVHATWADRIEQEEVAIDSLLNAAGLGAFEADQQALDRRIESLTGE